MLNLVRVDSIISAGTASRKLTRETLARCGNDVGSFPGATCSHSVGQLESGQTRCHANRHPKCFGNWSGDWCGHNGRPCRTLQYWRASRSNLAIFGDKQLACSVRGRVQMLSTIKDKGCFNDCGHSSRTIGLCASSSCVLL
eukprot:SAG31_NODE_2536_length_5550_cov_2.962759_4_plen_141_part_00